MKSKKLIFFIIIFLTLIYFSDLAASQHETLPSYHWAYQVVDELQARGLCLDLLPMNRPYTRGEVAASLRKAEKMLQPDDTSSQIVHTLLDMLKVEFRAELADLKAEKKSIDQIDSRLNIRADGLKPDGKRFEYRGIYRCGVGASILKNVYISSAINVDQYEYYNPNYRGHKWRGWVGFIEQGYATIDAGKVRIKLGRDFLKWGPGESGTLLFSDVVRPLDQISVNFFLGPFRFSFLVSVLDDMVLPSQDIVYPGGNIANRYISSHRLDMKFFKGRLQLGLSEAVIYGGVNRQVEWALFNPFLNFHGVQYNDDIAANTVGTIDVLFYPERKWKIYGSMLIDDIQVEKKIVGDLEPNEIGWIIGTRYADPLKIDGLSLNLEYTKIANRTYKTVKPEEVLAFRGVPLGHPLGNDFDHWNVGISYWLRPDLWLKFSFLKTRKGEGSLFSPWDSPWVNYTVAEGYHEPFPTGLVEKTSSFKMEGCWYFKNGLRIFSSLDYFKIYNSDHISGKVKNYWQGRVRVEVDCRLIWNLDNLH